MLDKINKSVLGNEVPLDEIYQDPVILSSFKYVPTTKKILIPIIPTN